MTLAKKFIFKKKKLSKFKVTSSFLFNTKSRNYILFISLQGASTSCIVEIITTLLF